MEIENSNLECRLTVASAGPRMANHRQKGRGYRSHEPYEFWWAPTIRVVTSIVSGAVSLGGWSSVTSLSY